MNKVTSYTVEEIVKDWNTIAPKYRTTEKLVGMAVLTTEARVRREILTKDIEELEGAIRRRKPTHGTCCTCQECGYPNDEDCECMRNEILTDLITKKKEALKK